MALKIKWKQRKTETNFYTFDPVIGYWGVRNRKGIIQFEQRPNVEIEINHNDRGLRDIAFKSSDSRGTILCMGGSHTWGAGVAQEQRYSDLLARRTGRQVINMGHCSLGIDQIAIAILKQSREYNPKVIVIEQYPWAVIRILRNSLTGNYIKPSFSLDKNGALKLKKIPWVSRFSLFRRFTGSFYAYEKELREFQGGIDLKENYDPLADPLFLYWKINHYDYLYNLLEKIILVIRDYCHQNGIHLLFCLSVIRQQFGVPSKSQLIDYDIPRERLKNILVKSSIAHIDLTDAMFKEHSEDDPVIFHDGHINVKGHDIFAAVLQEDLENRGWI